MKARRLHCPNIGCGFDTNSKKILDIHLKKCSQNTVWPVLSDYTVVELKEMASNRGITNTRNMRKAALIEMLARKVTGRVGTGGGVDKKQNWKELEPILGYTAYPGTLNVKLDYRMPNIDEGSVARVLRGGCIPAKINGVDCHLYSQKFLTGATSVFVIAPVRLRDTLNLKDGESVLIEIEGVKLNGTG